MRFQQRLIKQLHAAAEEKNLSKIKMCLDKGVDVNSLNFKGESIFHVAVMQNDVETINYLINRYTSVDVANNNDSKNELNFNIKNVHGQTVLHLAVKHSNKDLVTLLLIKCNIAVNEVDYKGLTALHYAVQNQVSESSSILLSELLVKYNANVNVKNKEGDSPLQLAVRLNKYELTRYYMSLGANINSKTNADKTPLFDAVEKGNKKMIKLLLKNGADVNAVLIDYEENILLYALRVLPEGQNLLDIVTLLLKAGVNINYENCFHNSALTAALERKIEPLIQLLISHNCCMKTSNNTPLFMAIRSHNTSFVELLLAKGADPNVQLRSWYAWETPLHAAVDNYNLEAVNLLLTYGANPNSMCISERLSSNRRTALNQAIIRGCEKIAVRLIEGGADVNLPDLNGDTPLHMVVMRCLNRRSCKDLMQRLLILGAKVDAYDAHKNTPLHLLDSGNKDTLLYAFILIRHMALLHYQRHRVDVKSLRLVFGCAVYWKMFTDCAKELARMQATKVDEGVSFYNLLVTGSHKMVQWVIKLEIINKVEDEILYPKFHRYNFMLKANYQVARKRLDLLQKASAALMRVIGMRLPLEIASMVCLLLSFKDLENVDLASKLTSLPKFTMSLRKRRKI